MPSFGEMLRRERQRHKLTIEAVAEATKINPRYLRALEDERLASLPGGLFNRGFLRTYAQYLGLEEAAVVEAYVCATGDAPQPSALPLPPEQSRRTPPGAGVILLRLLIAAGAILSLWAGWKLFRRHETRPSAAATTLSTAAPPAPLRPTTPAANHPPLVGVTQASHSRPDNIINAAVVVTAITQPTWISVTPDGGREWDTTLAPGQSQRLRYRHGFELVTGNAGATALIIDGHAQPPLGKMGQVIRLHWPPSASPGTQ